MKDKRRRQYLVETQLQFGLAMRLFTYWTATWLTVICVPILVGTFYGQLSFAELARSIVQDFWYPILISALVLPLAIVDYIRFSNRFAGPFCKIRRVIRDLADKKDVDLVTFRKDDFCQDVAADLNRIAVGMKTERNT